MKAIHLIAAGAVLVLASCSTDEVMQTPQQSPIGFQSYIGKVTRATDATTDNVNTITVYGYLGDAGTPKLFDGTIVSNTSGDWTYTPLQYWTAGKNYFFTAVASPTLEGNSHYGYTWGENLPTETENFYGAGTITLDNSATGASGNEDVIYAYQTATTPAEITAAPSRVEFAFKHALSRVKFTFNNAMGSDAYSIKVYDLTINNAAASGSLVLGDANPVWTASGSSVLTLRPQYYVPNSGIAANAQAVASGTKFIIPEEKALTISFNVDLILNGTTISTYSHSERALPSVAFKNGYSYNFVATLTPENIDPEQKLHPILFTVSEIEEWTEAADTTIDLKPQP